jgi:hypothetical protein
LWSDSSLVHECSALSRKTLQTLAQFGCPSIDRKAVNAGKRLRAFLQIEEVHVSNLPFLFFNMFQNLWIFAVAQA